MPNILVLFQPMSGVGGDSSVAPGSFGTTDEEGHFEMETADGDGAVVGKHTVVLMYKDPTLDPTKHDPNRPEPTPQYKLPPNARDGSLEFTVLEGGTDQALFAFESPKTREQAAPRRNPPRRRSW